MLSKVAVLALPAVQPFEFGVLCEVFGIDRTADGVPAVDFRVLSPTPGVAHDWKFGMRLSVADDLSFADEADLIAVPAFTGWPLRDDAVLDVLRRAHARGAWLLSVCSGAFALAEAGLLDGRTATTHWMHAAELAASHPGIHVDVDVLFIEQDRIVTSAGTAAGIDAALHIVRREWGAESANRIARRMVVPPQRSGGQSQYIETPIPSVAADSLADVLAWMQANLGEDVTVAELARRALLSERTFARRFRAETGTSPAAWMNQQRVLLAQRLLESTDRSIEQIAHDAGFGDAHAMRHHFTRRLAVAPNGYRRSFTIGSTAVPSAEGA